MRYVPRAEIKTLPRLFLLSVLALVVVLGGCGGQPTSESVVPSAEEQRQWVYKRVEAVAGLYSVTLEGREMLHSLDVRQMVGEPLFFGSQGYGGWTGVGQAFPMSVMHELGHAYWGAFPVSGRPDLSWEQPADGGLPSALRQYKGDLLTFMLQPPDRFEPLRDRLRNFPRLCSGDYPILYHTGEAEMVSLTGGDLELVPPILRKYYDRFLAPGPFQNWYRRLRWWAGLSSQDRHIAGAYLFDSHYPLMTWYENVPPLEGASVDPEARSLIEQEERQRLVDFALQFHLVVNGAIEIGSVLEWRRYVEEKIGLLSRYPDALKGLAEPRALELERNLPQLLEARQLSGGARVEATV